MTSLSCLRVARRRSALAIRRAVLAARSLALRCAGWRLLAPARRRDEWTRSYPLQPAARCRSSTPTARSMSRAGRERRSRCRPSDRARAATDEAAQRAAAARFAINEDVDARRDRPSETTAAQRHPDRREPRGRTTRSSAPQRRIVRATTDERRHRHRQRHRRHVDRAEHQRRDRGEAIGGGVDARVHERRRRDRVSPPSAPATSICATTNGGVSSTLPAAAKADVVGALAPTAAIDVDGLNVRPIRRADAPRASRPAERRRRRSRSRRQRRHRPSARIDSDRHRGERRPSGTTRS